jgi:hypothetical protein
VATVADLLAGNADVTVADRAGRSPENIARSHHDPEVRALTRRAAVSVRGHADLSGARAKEAQIARDRAGAAGRLAREQQKQCDRRARSGRGETEGRGGPRAGRRGEGEGAGGK